MPMWHAATRTWACARAPSVRYFVDPNWEQNPVGRGQLHVRRRRVRQHRVTGPSLRHPQRDRHRQRFRSVHVAGGYILSDGRKSPYSSAGPARATGRPRRSRLRAALRRVLRSRRHTCRRQQERQRVSPDRHQHRGTATGATVYQSAAPNTSRYADHTPRTVEESGAAAILIRRSAGRASAMAGPRLPASLAQSSGDRRKPAARGLAEHIRSAKDLTRNMNYRSPLTPSAGFGS